jgi:hypothetical protein
MTTTLNNGAQQQRKTLASQLDRLDTILDALSDGLNQAVAHTVEQAVGSAVRDTVQAVLAELLTNPLVLARLREALAPTVPVAQPAPELAVPPPEPSLADKARQVKAACGTFLGKMKGWCGVLADKTKACCRLARPHTRPLLLAAGVGVALGVTAYLAGPWFAAGAGWLAGFVTTLGVQAAVAFRRFLGLSG